MNGFRRLNFLGETRKSEILRRLAAVEQNLIEQEERNAYQNRMHILEFHKGQNGYIKPPEEDGQ